MKTLTTKLFVFSVSIVSTYLISLMTYMALAHSSDLMYFAALSNSRNDCDKDITNIWHKQMALGARLYFTIPGRAQDYADDGGSFIFPAVNMAICQHGEKQYSNNQRSVIRVIDLALAYGEPVNRLADDGFYAIHAAVIRNRLDILQYLVDNGADLSLETQEHARYAGMELGGLTIQQLAAELASHHQPVSTDMMNYLNSFNG